jgi:hypothetical protein
MGSARPRRRRAAAGRRRPRAGADTGRRRRGDHRGRCPGCRQPSHGTAGARRLLPVRRHRRTRRTRCSSAEQLGDRAIRPHRAHGAVRRPRPLTTAPAHPPSGAHRRGDRGGRAAPRARPLRSGSLTDAPAARPGGVSGQPLISPTSPLQSKGAAASPPPINSSTAIPARGRDLERTSPRQPREAGPRRNWPICGGIQEKPYFKPGIFPNVTTDPAKTVGHYTQVIWRATTSVGCGLASDGTNDYLVCRYSPAGNSSGVSVPTPQPVSLVQVSCGQAMYPWGSTRPATSTSTSPPTARAGLSRR